MNAITGNNGFLAVGNTMQLADSTPSGTWSSSDATIATVSSEGLVTGIGAGIATITYTVGSESVYISLQVLALEFTNGLDVSRVLPVLVGRKGWKQPTQTDFALVLDDVNTACSSGRYYNQDHPACSAYQLWMAQEDALITQDNFNQYLTDMQAGVVMHALNSVFRRPSLVEEPKILFEKQFRTQYVPIANNSKFCGWQLRPAAGDYTSKVDSISFTATAPCTVTLYVYNDLRIDPVWQTDITVENAYDQTIINIEDLYLSRLDDVHKGGMFYCGYYQDQLAAQSAEAVDVYLTWWEDPNMFAYQSFEAALDSTFGFVRDSYYSNWRTYGLGIELSTWWDYTNTIIRNAHEFDNLIGLMMAQKAIELTMQSMRSNIRQSIGQDQMEMLYETLEGRTRTGRTTYIVGTEYPTGIRGKIELEIKRIQKTFFPNDDVVVTMPPTDVCGNNLPSLGNMM